MDIHIVVNKKKHFYWGFLQDCHQVVFYIGPLEIDVYLRVDSWSLNQYISQWESFIEQLHVNGKSCLILEFYQDSKILEVFWYLFYKYDKKVIVQKVRICNDTDDTFKNRPKIIPKNCYQLIPEYKKYYPIYGDVHQVCWELSPQQFKNLKLRITTDKVRKVVAYDCVRAKISFEGFSQLVNMPIVHWSVDDYKKQWKDGIDRLEKHDSSCLIIRVVGKPYPMVERLLLYKRDNKIIVYFDYLISLDYQDEIGDNIITLKNCYDFISSEQKHLEKYRVDEWEFDIGDFDEVDIEYIDTLIEI